MSSEFFTSETELLFNFNEHFLSFRGSDFTVDDLLRAISPDAENPENDFESQLESLGLWQANTQLPHLMTNGTKFSQFSGPFLQNFAGGGYDQFLGHSYSEQSVPEMHFLPRGHSSGCFGETSPRPSMMPKSRFDATFSSSPDFQRQVMGCSSSPESFSSLQTGDMRWVCSTGDLQSPAAMDEPSLKVGRYSEEQRKERILKYRAKRSQRNFNKTIKYACRKTLADNRPRIRGRFARNDEPLPGDTSKAASSTTTDDDDDGFYIGMHGEDYGLVAGGGGLFATSRDQAQFQFYSY